MNMKKLQFSKENCSFFGGVGEIRTHGRLITVTRFPVVLVMTTSILLRVITSFATLISITHSFSKCKPFLKTFFLKILKLNNFLRKLGLFLKKRRAIIITVLLR